MALKISVMESILTTLTAPLRRAFALSDTHSSLSSLQPFYPSSAYQLLLEYLSISYWLAGH